MSDPMDSKLTNGMSDELRALTRRVDRLERSNRALKIVNLAALAAVVAIIRIPSIWALTPGVINALQYNLYSRSGALLATLGTNTSGFPSLTFFDATGKRLTQVGEADNGKGAGLFASEGNAVLPGKGVERAGFGISFAAGLGHTSPFDFSGEGELDGNGILRVASGFSTDLSADGLFLADAKQALRASVAQYEGPAFDGFGVGLVDANGKTRASMFADDLISTTTYAGFTLNDPTGPFNGLRGQFIVPLDESSPTGGPNFALYDVNGKYRVTAGVNNSITTSAGFNLFDASENDRAGFVEPPGGGNYLIYFNDAAGKNLGVWQPPAAPVP